MSSNAGATDGRAGGPEIASNATVRIVYQAVRALIADDGPVTVNGLTAVTCLDGAAATAAMDRLAATDSIDVEPLTGADEPTWAVTRTDRW